MKKISFAKALSLVVLVVSVLILSTGFTFAQAGFVRGDVDSDGEVTPADSRLALRHSVGLVVLKNQNLDAADYDLNGVVDPADARWILRKSANLDDTITETQTTIPETTQLTGTGSWSKAYMTYFSSEEGGGENLDTSLVSRVLIWSGGRVVPNYSKGVDIGPDNIVTFYGFNILGTTNRRILPMGSVVEYRVAGRYFQGVVLDNNGDNMAGRSLVTMDHLFIKSSQGERFMNSLINSWEYLPICEYRIIGRINTSTGEVTPQ